MSLLKDSLIRRFGLALTAISLVALLNIGLSLAVARSIEGSATAMNVAGSLRMQAYEALVDWHRARDQLLAGTAAALRGPQLERLGQRLDNLTRVASIPDSPDHPIAIQYARTQALWQEQLQPLLSRAPLELTPDQMHQAVESLAAELNRLVSLLETRTEARIQLVNLIQGLSLVFTLLILGLMLYDIRNNIARPLQQLLEVARAVGQRDFSQRSGLHGGDELSQLGQALDQTSEALAASYRGLEDRVEEKTHELIRSQAVLQLLHNASRNLYSSGDLCDGAVPMLQQLEELLGIGPIKLYLHDRNAPEPVQVVTTSTITRPFYCKDHSCNACLVTPQAFEEEPLDEHDGIRLLLPIRTAAVLLGTLEVWYPKNQELPETSRRLLETLTDQLATAIFLQQQITEQQQLTLIEERAVIARELHDSLAQSLSYLKIQVARLRKLDQITPATDLHQEILDELSTGLNSAYRQLRELLTTFRLKLNTPDLGSALQETVNEFSDRMPNPVGLEYELPPQTLSANEEIHVLQIVREALSNAVKHAQASQVRVAVRFRSPQVYVQVTDNGRGLPAGESPPQHYGLIIMQDRARTLGGKIIVSNKSGGGVDVTLAFVPKARNLIATQASA